jgi:hypothetical protein
VTLFKDMTTKCTDPALALLVGALYDAIACRSTCRGLRLAFTSVQVGTIFVEGDITMIKVPVDVTAVAAIRVTDSFGNAAAVDGVATWALSDPAGVELMPAADGMSATVKSLDGGLRTVQLQVSVDADLGSGVQALSAVADVEFVAGTASAIAIDITTPTP